MIGEAVILSACNSWLHPRSVAHERGDWDAMNDAASLDGLDRLDSMWWSNDRSHRQRVHLCEGDEDESSVRSDDRGRVPLWWVAEPADWSPQIDCWGRAG